MILVRTPYRVSLFGGGTDFPAWFTRNGGKCLSFTIDKYSYISAKFLLPFFEHKFRISYSKIETAKSIDEIKNPAFREIIRLYSSQGIEVQHHGDLPARSGLGSSSAFVVGLIHALLGLQGQDVEKVDLANRAISLEQSILKENVGSQDQIACALGGVNRIEFGRDGQWKNFTLQLTDEKIRAIESSTLLVFSGVQRTSSDISASMKNSFRKSEKLLYRLMEMVDYCEKLLKFDEIDFQTLSEILNESWHLKSEINPLASNQMLDNVYRFGLSNGAMGAKVLGAGGGGFMLFVCRQEEKENLAMSFSKKGYIVVPMRLEFSGSTLISLNW
jgi:D-glycero-alpha-D-manno-heptose-7-phosphate kinase